MLDYVLKALQGMQNVQSLICLSTYKQRISVLAEPRIVEPEDQVVFFFFFPEPNQVEIGQELQYKQI